jgi:NitT/TauT family transport system substrate-binding protein
MPSKRRRSLVIKEDIMKREWIAGFGLVVALMHIPVGRTYAQPEQLEKPSIRIAVGGKSALFYLPLSVTERLGYFKDAGLDVEIDDLSSGARALQAVVAGSADVGTGTFDHAIQMQAKHQPVVAVVQMGRYPGLVMGVTTPNAAKYKGPEDLKGMRIGVTGLGSSTQFMAGYIMVRHGLNPDTDASFVATGTTSTAVAAARRAEIDAIVTSDPMASVMTDEKLIKVIADTRTPDGTEKVYGGPYPGGVVYATPSFIKDNPKTTQAVVNAFVRGLRWIASHSPEDIAKLMPPEYAMGNAKTYVEAITASKPMYSPDGHFLPRAAQTAYDVLKQFNPPVAAAKIDLSKTYTDDFLAKVPPPQ